MFSSIGDQEILKEEVLWNRYPADIALNQETFGYIPRFSEMRYNNNKTLGGLWYNEGLSQTLGRFWNPLDNVGAEYSENISINRQFVSSGVQDSVNNSGNQGKLRLTDTFRILPSSSGFQYPTTGVIYSHIFHSLYVNRELPVYSIPDLT